MDNIFIDASIFIKENFLEGRRIQQLLKLGAEKQIQIVLTRITVNEIKAKYKRLIISHKEQVGKFYALKNTEAGKLLLNNFATLDIGEEFSSLFDEKLQQANVIIIEYQKIEIEKLLNNYFDELPPFNSKNKKNEFPDAITIQLMEEWCEANNQTIKTLSTDKDFEGYHSSFVRFEKTYENYIDQSIKSFELYKSRVELLHEIFPKNNDRIDGAIREWYIDKLWDETMYYDIVNYHEIHNIEEPIVNVSDKSFKITFIDEEYIVVEISATVNFEVELEIDNLDYAVYDSEEKEYIYLETKTEKVEREVKAKVIAVAYIENKEDYDEDIEIEDINKGINFKIENDYEYR